MNISDVPPPKTHNESMGDLLFLKFLSLHLYLCLAFKKIFFKELVKTVSEPQNYLPRTNLQNHCLCTELTSMHKNLPLIQMEPIT